MKLMLLCTLVLLSTFHPCNAQRFSGGLKAGLMGTQVDGDGFRGFHKPGIAAGAWVQLRWAHHHAFQMELGYVQKGSRKNPNYMLDDLEQYILRTDYIELPLLYQLIYSEKIAFEAGISLGYLMHTYELTNLQQPNEVPFRRGVVNYIGGIYYSLNERLDVNFRVNNSIVSLRKADRYYHDTYRFGHWGQFHIALMIGLQLEL
ncbi:MAG TPA: porin family protein [Bacteroidales bacterium]|nr:porin family protein [Bacteroidales bacterium]